MLDFLLGFDVEEWRAPAAAAFTVCVVVAVTVMRRRRALQIKRALEIERRLYS